MMKHLSFGITWKQLLLLFCLSPLGIAAQTSIAPEEAVTLCDLFSVKPYSQYKHDVAYGQCLLDSLSTLYYDTVTFDKRRQLLKQEFRSRLHIDQLLARCVKADMHLSDKRRMDGYTVQNFYLETLPGLYVCGSVYAPSWPHTTLDAKKPLIMCPNGHFPNGRYYEDLQRRLATLARMGAVCVSWDLFGWGESALQVSSDSHRLALAQSLQLLQSLCVTDAMLQRRDIDPTRVALNGASGGGVACIMLSVLDDRFTACCPVVSFVSHFDGGCPCESGFATSTCAGGTCNAEYAALFAPKPMTVISVGGDWTSSFPDLEYPYLQRIYSFYGVEDCIKNIHLDDERHDFGTNKRQLVYDFFVLLFGLDAQRQDESEVTIESVEALQSFGSIEKFPAGAIKSLTELQQILCK